MESDDLSVTVQQVEAARAGDAASLEALCQRYLPRVRRMVACRLGRPLAEFVAEEDLVQQTFIDVVGAIESFEHHSHGTFCDWVARIIENNLRDAARRQGAQKRGAGQVRRMADLDQSHLSGALFPGREPSPSRVAGAKEMEAALERALLGLSGRYREVINLRVNGGMSYREIATVMDLPSENTANSLFIRARTKLSRALES